MTGLLDWIDGLSWGQVVLLIGLAWLALDALVVVAAARLGCRQPVQGVLVPDDWGRGPVFTSSRVFDEDLDGALVELDRRLNSLRAFAETPAGIGPAGNRGKVVLSTNRLFGKPLTAGRGPDDVRGPRPIPSRRVH